jgi:hypothetical protein
MPPKPNMAAMIAIIKKITDQRNIKFNLNGQEDLFSPLSAARHLCTDLMKEIFVPTSIDQEPTNNCRGLST